MYRLVLVPFQLLTRIQCWKVKYGQCETRFVILLLFRYYFKLHPLLYVRDWYVWDGRNISRCYTKPIFVVAMTNRRHFHFLFAPVAALVIINSSYENIRDTPLFSPLSPHYFSNYHHPLPLFHSLAFASEIYHLSPCFSMFPNSPRFVRLCWWRFASQCSRQCHSNHSIFSNGIGWISQSLHHLLKFGTKCHRPFV